MMRYDFFRYYKEDKDVKEDVELQAYFNEVSLNGTGPNGGIGMVNIWRKNNNKDFHNKHLCRANDMQSCSNKRFN